MSEVATVSSPVLDEIVNFLNSPLPNGLNPVLMANDAEVTKCRDMEASSEEAEKVKAYLANNADYYHDGILFEFDVKGCIGAKQVVLKFLREVLRGHEVIYLDIYDWARGARKLWAYWVKQVYVLGNKITMCDVVKVTKKTSR